MSGMSFFVLTYAVGRWIVFCVGCLNDVDLLVKIASGCTWPFFAPAGGICGNVSFLVDDYASHTIAYKHTGTL